MQAGSYSTEVYLCRYRLSRRQEEEEEEESWVLVGNPWILSYPETEKLIPALPSGLNSSGTDRKIIWSGDNKASLTAANERQGWEGEAGGNWQPEYSPETPATYRQAAVSTL